MSEDQDSAEFTSEETLTDSNDNFTDSSSGKLFGRTSSDSSETSPGGPALSTDISPEASEGSWASCGSNWMFLVDDKPYTGWFTDTDGKQYYMDETGIMQTGWTDIGKKRYYFDMDGILQTGTVKIGKKTYELDTDGSLKGYTPKKKTSGKSGSSDASAAKKSIALTFDDGPGQYTEELLDCLEENNAHATFFMLGQLVGQYPDEVKRKVELGCEIGNHSWDHQDMLNLSIEDVVKEFGDTDQALIDACGQESTVIRPPYGDCIDEIISAVGKPFILWSIDRLDWKYLDADLDYNGIMNDSNLGDGAVILMHDIHGPSVDAALRLIPDLIAQGYKLVTVSEMAAAKNVTLQPAKYAEVWQSALDAGYVPGYNGNGSSEDSSTDGTSDGSSDDSSNGQESDISEGSGDGSDGSESDGYTDGSENSEGDFSSDSGE